MNYNAYFIASAPKEFEVCSYYWGVERMFLCYIRPKRRNGIIDTIPIVITDNMKNKMQKMNRKNKLEFYGRICTKSMLGEDGKRHLKVFVLVERCCEAGYETCDINSIYIENAYICKKELIGGDIPYKVEGILAVNYKLNPSAYVPMIAWNRNAKKLAHMPIGEQVKLSAKFQSREYIKSEEIKTTYELAIISIE